MIIRESNFSDISSFLKSDDLYFQIENILNDSYSTCEKIIKICKDTFDVLFIPKITRVQILKVSTNDYQILDSDYYVIEYNNRFYDYCAYSYFNDIFKIYELPIIQPVLKDLNYIHSTVSTLKNYVIIKYNQGLNI